MKTIDITWIVLNITTTSVLEVFFMSVFANTNWKTFILWNLDFMNGSRGCAPFSAARGRQERTSSHASGAVRVRARAFRQHKGDVQGEKKKTANHGMKESPGSLSDVREVPRMRSSAWSEAPPSRAEPSRTPSAVLRVCSLCNLAPYRRVFCLALSLSL